MIDIQVQKAADYSLSGGPSAFCDRKINLKFSVKFEAERKYKTVSAVQLDNPVGNNSIEV